MARRALFIGLAGAVTLCRCVAYDHDAYRRELDASPRSDTPSPAFDAGEMAVTMDVAAADDVSLDAGPVVAVDVPADVGVDALLDVPREAAPDAGLDAGSDVVADVAADVPVDAAPVTLLGTQTLGDLMDSDPNGQAEAFSTTANASGTLTSLVIYAGPGTMASTVTVGLYSSVALHPSALIVQGTASSPHPASWVTVRVPPTPVIAGTTYWIAVLVPASASGVMQFVDHSPATAGGTNETSAAVTLTALPAAWTSARGFTNGPLSAYGLGGP